MRLRRFLNAVGALIAAAVLMVALPAGLMMAVGWPLPTAIPTPDDIQLALRSGIDPQFLINVLAVIVWVVWAQLMLALTVEVVAVARGRSPRRLPLMPGLQAAASRLVAAVVLVAATTAPLNAASAGAVPLAGFVPEPVSSSLPVDGPTAFPAPTPSRQHTQDLSYTTGRLDTLWSIAEATLGDGRRWHEIRSLNPDVTTSDGGVEPGIDLTLPSDAKIASEESGPSQITVEAGDTFWSIARDRLTRVWGRSPNVAEIDRYWRQVIDTNRDRLAPPYNPDVIYPGQVFELPPPSDDPVISESNAIPNGVVVVEKGDSIWSIARETLAEAWGRRPTDAETSGFVRDFIDHNRDQLDDPDVIYPGDTLRPPAIPGDAAVGAPSESEAKTQRPGDSEPESVEADSTNITATEEPNHWGPDPELPAVEPPGSGAPQVSRSPQATDRNTAPDVVAVPTTRDTTADEELHSDGSDEDIDNTGDSGLLPTGAALAGLGILAAGLIALLDRLRRIQFQHRRPGTIPTPPPDSASPVEATLRSAAVPTATELIDGALRAIGHHAVAANTPAPHVVGVHISDARLRVLLWNPNPHAPDGWVTDDDNASWVLPSDADLTHLHLESDGIAAPYPTLVTAGHTPDGQLLLDLEFIGALRVAGTPDSVRATCHTIATELAASTFADFLSVICVGFGHDLEQLERVQVVDRLDSILLDHLEAKARSVDESPVGSLMEGRMGPGGDSLYPVVVIDPATTAPEGAERLLATALSGRAVAAVVGYPTGDRWSFNIEDSTVRVEPLGHTLSRRDLTPREQDGVTNLVAAAKDLAGSPSDQAKIRAALNGNGALHEVSSDSAEQARLFAEEVSAIGSSVEVRVLGTASVEGASLRGRRSVELCAYLALHRDGVEADRLMEALWPDEAPDYKRLNRTVSGTRLDLGAGPDGEHYLPRVTGGIYRLSTHFGCDLTRFTEQTSIADTTDGEEEIDHLRAALELVSGTPFSGIGNGYAWVWTEGLYSFSVVAVDEAAHRLSDLALDQKTPALATWSARQGLLATPSCESCYRNLMGAAIAQDNKVALEVIFGELVAVVEADDGPDAMSFLDPETVDLYERHSRRHSHRKR